MRNVGRSVARRLALVCAGVAAGLLLAEGVLRVLHISYPVFFERDPIAGAWHRPGVSGWHIREGHGWAEINSAGMRDREHALEKPPDVFRIAVLGDSYAEALQVDLEETFWSVLERELSGCSALTGRRAEVLDFGVSGHGTAQQLQVLRHRAWDYDPDLVLLAFVSNDVRNNSRVLEGDPARPYYVFRGDRLVLDESYLSHPAILERRAPLRRLRRAISDYSYLVQLLGETRNLLRRRELAEVYAPKKDQIYVDPTDERWQEAWRVTEAVLAKMHGEVAERGVRFLLVLLSDPQQANPDPEWRRAIEEKNGVEDLFYLNRRLRAFAARQGMDVLSLAEPFQRYAEAEGVCLHGFENAEPCGGHWNQAGHRLGGELIARRVCELIGATPPR